MPTREQFKRLVEAIRVSDGRADSQQKAKPGADLVELLVYSGCRIQEAVSDHLNKEREPRPVLSREVCAAPPAKRAPKPIGLFEERRPREEP